MVEFPFARLSGRYWNYDTFPDIRNLDERNIKSELDNSGYMSYSYNTTITTNGNYYMREPFYSILRDTYLFFV